MMKMRKSKRMEIAMKKGMSPICIIFHWYVASSRMMNAKKSSPQLMLRKMFCLVNWMEKMKI